MPSQIASSLTISQDEALQHTVWSETVLITGGTGSFGRAFARFLLDNTPAHVRLFSRDEHKQADLARTIPPGPRVTYILGDVRDRDRLAIAADGCTGIVHAAALKTVPAGERQADEFVKTNVSGTQNVIWAALACRVPHTLLVSSDKACHALNHYGKTKAVAEGLIVQANALGVSRGCRFASVRGGNVWASRGSVAQIWHQARDESRPIPFHSDGQTVTRFHLEMLVWCAFGWRAITEMHGGEIFVPKARAWALADLAVAFGGPQHHLRLRAGEKAAETLITADEAARTVDAGWAYVVEPSSEITQVWNYQPWQGWRPPVEGLAYTSDTVERLDAAELAELVRGLG